MRETIPAAVIALLLLLVWSAAAGNPLLVPSVGLADPHVRVINDRVYMFATHDYSANNTDFLMRDWWVWSTRDLVEWSAISTLDPRNTCLRTNWSECWATDAASNATGAVAFYVSLGPDSIGVVTSESGAAGPWRDVLGRPLVAKGSFDTQARDPSVFRDADGKLYLVFGTFKYFIGQLNEDLVSFTEGGTPREVLVQNSDGPYGPGKTDDKPFLHMRSGVYYLSWGCYYATSASVLGPYLYAGMLLSESSLDDEFKTEDWMMDRHGSIFEWRGQWYFACNDRTHGGSQYFRNTVIGYLHYYTNGSIAPVRITSTGVGQHDLARTRDRLAVAEYDALSEGTKQENAFGDFDVLVSPATRVAFARVSGASPAALLHCTLFYANGGSVHDAVGVVDISVLASSSSSALSNEIRLLCKLPPTGGWNSYANATCEEETSSGARLLAGDSAVVDVVLMFRGGAQADAAVARVNAVYVVQAGRN